MEQKRILLMYISQVSGHRSAAMAIEKAVKTLSPDSQVLGINAFKYTNPVSEKIINRIYMEVVSRAPKIWDYLYDNQKVVKGLEKIKARIHKFNSPKLKKLFEEFSPDVVACTQAFPCGMVADYKKIYKSDIPLVAVLTDFVPHSFWIYDTVNFFIAPSEEVAKRLTEKGVDAGKIKPFGIPFDIKFNEPGDRGAVLKKLGLSPGLPILLIMGGGHGLGPIGTIVGSLEKLNQPVQEIVVCAANTKLYNSLKKQTRNYKKKIIILGFVDNIHELMCASDIIITKPGGITTAEALAKKLPMVIIRPIPGQEANNTAYLTEKKAAIKVDDLENIDIIIEDLLLHPEKLSQLRQYAGEISRPNASIDIAKLLLGF